MITTAEFQQRRQRVLAQMRPNSLCILPAARQVTRSNDTEYAFRQNSDFWYLTGFPEQDAVLVMTNHPDKDIETLLFCLDKDPVAEIWHGRRIGAEAAAEKFAVDEALAVDQLEGVFGELLDGHDNLYFAQGLDAELDELVFATMDSLRNAPKQSKQAPACVMDIRPLVHEMRLFKSNAELRIMRKAGKITADAHCRAMQSVKALTHEYQLEAEIHHAFAMQGARFPAYASIVGGGENACILHYTENSDALNDGDLVLIDAGCELDGYAADITRTFPVNGQFSAPQRSLYQLVLDAQDAALALLKPGNTLKQATDKTIEVLTAGLIERGLLEGSVEDNVEQQTYRRFFMHGLGHWLGLDVHDVGDYKVEGQDRPLQPGMVLTVEPGLYIAPDAEVDAKWCGIGIRIEDNIVITEQGYENLTADVPKSIDEVERLVNGIDSSR